MARLADGNGIPIAARHIAEAAHQGEYLANDIVAREHSFFGQGNSSCDRACMPASHRHRGGVSLMGEKLLFEPLRELVAERVFKPFADCYDIVPAALGEEVVVHGALALAASGSADRLQTAPASARLTGDCHRAAR